MKDKYTDYIVIFSVILVISLTIFWITRTSVNGEVREIITTPINTDIQINSIQSISSDKKYSTSGKALGDGAIISRPIEMLGGYRHYGIMYNGLVSHFNEYGYHEDSIKEFAKNLPIKVIRGGLSGEDLAKFKANYKYYKDKYKKSKYNAVDNNCEHYVNEVIFGVHQSMQSDFTKEMVKCYDSVFIKELNKSDLGRLCIPLYKNTKDKYIKDTVIK